MPVRPATNGKQRSAIPPRSPIAETPARRSPAADFQATSLPAPAARWVRPARPRVRATALRNFGLVYPQSRRMARRQFDVDQRARVANHHVAHQVAHLVFIGRRARFAAGHITATKLLFSFEDSRLEKRQ